METSQQNPTHKVCTKCGRDLPLEKFGKGNGLYGVRSQCKECSSHEAREYLRRRKNRELVKNPALSEFTPQDLITELRARGYTGDLVYTEVKVHKIKL